VTNDVVGVALEEDLRIGPRHPHIERIMQEEVRQKRADHALNAKGNFVFERRIEGWRGGLVLDLRRKK
jgi:hypothetical protein